jgi:glucuronate isomerase
LIHDDFLLHSEAARQLYHRYAAAEPILDYHSHLPASDIAGNRRFRHLAEVWLSDDHYKWRAMRANGIEERYVTGSAAPYEKFLAWARTVPYTLRNPLYHWTHLELARYFGIYDLLDEVSAPEIWRKANDALADGSLSARGILRRFRVEALCTSDDPCCDLAHHRSVAASEKTFCVYPTFRPDRALAVDDPQSFRAWVEQLSRAGELQICCLADFLDALGRRHDAFHAAGARLSDHGLNSCFASPCDYRTAAQIFDRACAGSPAAAAEHGQFAAFMMIFFGRLDAEKHWTQQLHLGALRNVNSRRTAELGPDSGSDSIGDWSQAEALCKFLDRLDREQALPKTILYNVNPADNYVLATAVGNFQDGKVAGKLQFGSAWWFLDQKEGIEWQLNALSHTGLLSRFIGMITDSRSFLSFPRHEYFRRVLCNLLGAEMEKGELPNDERLVGEMVRRICFANARDYLGLPLPGEGSAPSPPAGNLPAFSETKDLPPCR